MTNRKSARLHLHLTTKNLHLRQSTKKSYTNLLMQANLPEIYSAYNTKTSSRTRHAWISYLCSVSTYVDGHIPAGFTECDKKLKETSGIEVIGLHGCSNSECHGHVYGPEDKRTCCPCCGSARYVAG